MDQTQSATSGNKICSVCRTEKPLDQFYVRSNRPDGHTSQCKACDIKRVREKQAQYKAQPKPDISGTMKTCPRCAKEKPITEFNQAKSTRSGVSTYCKPCAYELYDMRRRANLPQFAEISRQWRAKNPERNRDHGLKKNYGVPLGTYARMLEAQNGKCAICGRTDSGSKRGRFHLDHDHATGVIRGLLCHGCNVGIGSLRHDVNLLYSAIEYLRLAEGRTESTGAFNTHKE
jgi:hypothetical protein